MSQSSPWRGAAASDSEADPVGRSPDESGVDPAGRPWMTSMVEAMAEDEARLASSGGLEDALMAAVVAAREDNIVHLELAVSPAALSRSLGSLGAAFDALTDAIQALPPEGRPSVGWLICIAASEQVQLLARTVAAASEHKRDGILGLVVQLADNDPPESDGRLSKAAAAAGLPVMVELGPDISPDSVPLRLERIAPARIAFGAVALQSFDAIDWIRQNRPALVVSLSAERSAGMWVSDTAHPIIQMIQAGMQVSLSTWAPGPLDLTLSGEYALAAERLALTLEALRGLTLAGVQASFLPTGDKRRLEREFEESIFGFPREA